MAKKWKLRICFSYNGIWQCFFFEATLSKLPSIYSWPWLNGHFVQHHWHQQGFVSSPKPSYPPKESSKSELKVHSIDRKQKPSAHSNVTHFRFLDGFAADSSSGFWSGFFAKLLDLALALALAFAASTAAVRSLLGRRVRGGLAVCSVFSALGMTDLTGNGLSGVKCCNERVCENMGFEDKTPGQRSSIFDSLMLFSLRQPKTETQKWQASFGSPSSTLPLPSAMKIKHAGTQFN